MKKTRKLIAIMALGLFTAMSTSTYAATTIDFGDSCNLFKKLVKKYGVNTPQEFLKLYPIDSPLYVTSGDSKYDMSKALSELKLYSSDKRWSFGLVSVTTKGIPIDGGNLFCMGVPSASMAYRSQNNKASASVDDPFKPLLVKNTRTSYAKRLPPNEIDAMARKIKETADKYAELARPLYYDSENKEPAIKKARVEMEKLLNSEQFRKLFVTFLDQFKNDYYEYKLYLGEISPEDMDLGAPPDETDLLYLFSMNTLFSEEIHGKNLNLYSGYDKGDGSEFKFNIENIIKWLLVKSDV